MKQKVEKKIQTVHEDDEVEQESVALIEECKAEKSPAQIVKQNRRKRLSKKVFEKKQTVCEDNEAEEENQAPNKRRKTEKNPVPTTRFNPSLGHLPRIDKTRLVRCKFEGCPKKDAKSYISCPTCNVHLCLSVESNRNCFAKYHTIKDN